MLVALPLWKGVWYRQPLKTANGGRENYFTDLHELEREVQRYKRAPQKAFQAGLSSIYTDKVTDLVIRR